MQQCDKTCQDFCLISLKHSMEVRKCKNISTLNVNSTSHANIHYRYQILNLILFRLPILQSTVSRMIPLTQYIFTSHVLGYYPSCKVETRK